MLRQVSLLIRNPANPFRDLALKHGCKITVVECKDFNSHGIALVLEVEDSRGEDDLLVKELKNVEGVRRAYWAAGSQRNSGTLAMVVMDTPSYCRIARDSGVVCSSCLFNSLDGLDYSWKLLVSDASSLRKSLDMLKEHGITAETKEVSSARHEEMLTSRQREIMLVAIHAGYFEFPRRIGLTQLARKLSIRPSTLSEILRRAEDKITKSYAEDPLSTIVAVNTSETQPRDRRTTTFSEVSEFEKKMK